VEHFWKFFGFALGTIKDHRVNQYLKDFAGGAVSFSKYRLERFFEILNIIPKEWLFMNAVGIVISIDDEKKNVAYDAANRSMWMRNKGRFSEEEKLHKAGVDDLISFLRADKCISENVRTYLSSHKSLVHFLEEQNVNINTASHNTLRVDLIRLRERYFYLYDDAQGGFTYSAYYYKAILERVKNLKQQISAELSKVTKTKGTDSIAALAIVSKNVGSFFAKAGAELCTSSNVDMWNEKRHVHLNLVANQRIIGNVMLYFEPKRNYLVARGFNPRNDLLQKVDQESIVQEIVRVVCEIAKSNGYKEVYIPVQDQWHALSNRDGVAKEVLKISKRTIDEVRRNNRGQRTEIIDHPLEVEEIGGTTVDKLLLLAVVPDVEKTKT
jgi:hypothetical protein